MSNLPGLSSGKQYAYSTARANAMKSKLLSKKTMQDISNTKEIGQIISMLFEQDYRQEIEEFGGLKIKSDLVDFALSKNLARNILKLIKLTQGKDRQIMQGIAGKWDLYNIRLAIEAKDKRQSFDSIARYVIDSGRYGSEIIKEAMREESMEGMISKLMINSPYRRILAKALETYKSTKNSFETLTALDKEYYSYLANLAVQLGNAGERSGATVVRMEIDMRNILTMIRGKRLELKFSSIAPLMIENGNIKPSALEQIYTSSGSMEEMLSQTKLFDMKEAIEFFKKDSRKQLLTFEIGLRNAIFMKGISSLGHKMLSFGTMLAYIYMKESEVSTIRTLINGKSYGLEKEEIDRLISWRLN